MTDRMSGRHFARCAQLSRADLGSRSAERQGERNFCRGAYLNYLGEKQLNKEDKWGPVFPHGQGYVETPILRSNIEACIKFCQLIETFQIDSLVLRKTMEKALLHLFSFQDYIDFSPLIDLPGCENRLAAKRLSFIEIVKILLGGIVTLNDRVSLEITGGLYLTKVVWKVHNISYRLFQVH